MTSVFLVRHGDAVWTPDEMRPLSPLGRDQAEAVADCLRGVALDAVYASPYLRARQTVEPLAERVGLAVQEEPDFRERLLSGGAVADFAAASRATWDDFSMQHPGGESNARAQQRGVGALRRLVDRHRAGRMVVGTHGTVLALMLNALDSRYGFTFWQGISTPDVYRLDLDDAASPVVERLWTP